MDDTDWKAIAQTMAADNARLCDRLLTAEAVIEQVRRFIKVATTPTRVIDPDYSVQALQLLVDKHDAGRAS